MKENQVLLFKRLTHSTLKDVFVEADKSKQAVVEKIKKEYENSLPGEFSFAQVDLNNLYISNVPQDLLSDKAKLLDQKLFGNNYLGRYGKVKGAEDIYPTKDGKFSGNLRIMFFSNVQAALSLMVVLV